MATSKMTGGGGQGSHNKPRACGSSGAYAPGPDDEEEEEVLGEKSVPTSLFPSQIPHGLVWDGKRASAVSS